MIQSSFYNTYVEHQDMPFCVTISSCDIDKTTKSPHQGSELTQVIFKQLSGNDFTLNFQQFYFHIISAANKLFKGFFSDSSLTPVLSSTSNRIDMTIPFFGKTIIIRPRKIYKN
jgi:hypothetical protein